MRALMTEILNDNGTLDFQLTDIECPKCRAKVGDWCQDNKGVVKGGALLTCAPRMRAIVSLNRNRHGNRVLHTFEEWLTIGRDNGWCSDQVCATHDGVPLSASERDEQDAGGDPCMLAVRIYDSPQQAYEVGKANSAPNCMPPTP